MYSYQNREFYYWENKQTKYGNNSKEYDLDDPMSIETVQYYLKDFVANFHIKIILAYLISIILFIHKHVHFSFYIVIALGFADLFVGILRAFLRREVCSKKAGRGVIKVFLYMIFVGVGVLVDYGLFHRLPEYGFSYLVTSTIIVNLTISILENLYDLGCPVPESLIAWLRRVRDSINKEAPPPSSNLR